MAAWNKITYVPFKQLLVHSQKMSKHFTIANVQLPVCDYDKCILENELIRSNLEGSSFATDLTTEYELESRFEWTGLAIKTAFLSAE